MDFFYLIGSLAGVGLLVVLNRVLFGAARPAIASTAALEAALAHEAPDFQRGAAVISADANAGLMENAADGRVFLAVTQGYGVVTRALGHGALRDVVRDGAALTLKLNDFTLPKVRLILADEAAARHWQTRLGETRSETRNNP